MGDAHAPGRRRFGAFVTGVFVVPMAVVGAVACGSKGVDQSACRQIEEARCQAAPACAISITPPNYTSGTDVEACKQYYDVACLAGLTVASPSSAEVTACLDAIQSSCTYVTTPQDSPGCAWLAPSADAGTVAADASADASDATDGATASDSPAEAEDATD